jgi:hypothetical protein
VRRLRRDPEAIIQFESAITDNRTSDPWATQLASYLAAAHPLGHDVVASLTARYRHEHAAELPDAIRDRVAVAELPAPITLLRALESATVDAPIL